MMACCNMAFMVYDALFACLRFGAKERHHLMA
jgi:hypothetical protein